jgi:hypothetical protein
MPISFSYASDLRNFPNIRVLATFNVDSARAKGTAYSTDFEVTDFNRILMHSARQFIFRYFYSKSSIVVSDELSNEV